MAVYSAPFSVRWSDQDLFGHVNHARILTIMEESGIKFFLEGEDVVRNGMVVRRVEVDYHRPILWGNGIVEVFISDIKKASFNINYILHQKEHRSAVGKNTLVAVDRERGSIRRLTPAELFFLEAWTR